VHKHNDRTVEAMRKIVTQPARRPSDSTSRITTSLPIADDLRQRLPVGPRRRSRGAPASFNRMQAGLADGGDSTRLRNLRRSGPGGRLEQGDDVLSGDAGSDVMFIDIAIHPYAEANTAEDTVARLNALFEIVVPARRRRWAREQVPR